MNIKYLNLASNVFIFGIGNLLVKVIQFFLLPIYTLYMSSSDYGIAELLKNYSEMLCPIVTLCIHEAVFRFVLEKEYMQSMILNTALCANIIANILNIILMILMSYFIEFQYVNLLALIVLSYSFMTILGNYYKGLNNNKIYITGNLINSSSLFVFTIIFLEKLFFSINGYLMAIIAANICSLIYYLYKLKIKISFQYNYNILKSMLNFSFPLIINTLGWWGINTFSKYLIFYVLGSSIAGLFAAASKLPAVINTVAAIFQQAWQISATQEYNKEDKNKFFTVVFSIYYALVTTFAAFIILINDNIAFLLLKRSFYEAKIYIPLLIFAMVFNCYSGYFSSLYIAIKSTRLLTMSTLVGLFVNILVSWSLIGKYGVWACIIATVICYIIIIFIKYYYIRTDVILDINIKKFCLIHILLFVEALTISFDIGGFLNYLLFFVILSLNMLANKAYIVKFAKNMLK